MAIMYIMSTTTFTAKEAKNNFGRLIDEAHTHPVSIEKHGRKVAVVVSARDYEEFEAMRDAYWGMAASRSHTKGYIGTKKSQKLIERLANARN